MIARDLSEEILSPRSTWTGMHAMTPRIVFNNLLDSGNSRPIPVEILTTIELLISPAQKGAIVVPEVSEFKYLGSYIQCAAGMAECYQ